VGPELRRGELVARIEQQHIHALSREVPRGHPARGATADDDDGVDLGGLMICMAILRLWDR
jgi:hypothetical protein